MDTLPFSSKVAEPTTGRFRAERGRGRRGQAAAAARPWPCPALAQPHCATAFLQLCLHHALAPIHKGEGRNGLDLCLVFVTSSTVSPSEQLDSIAAFLVGFMEGVSPKGQGADGPSWRYYSWYACFRRERSPTSRALPTAATSTRLREVPLQSRHVKQWDFPWMVHASRTSRCRPQTVAGDKHSTSPELPVSRALRGRPPESPSRSHSSLQTPQAEALGTTWALRGSGHKLLSFLHLGKGRGCAGLA